MKNTINIYEFKRWFEEHRPINFSYQGLNELFDYLEQYEEDCETELEFDPIALCCEYTEFEDLAEFWGNYDKETYPDFDTITDYTQLIRVGKDSFIIANF